MASTWRALRRRIITPSAAETSLERRGFHEKDAAARELLEGIGQVFLTGYAYAAEAKSPAAAEEKLEEVPRQFRGFAYEGAAMGFTILDAMPFARRRRFAEFVAGRGSDHIYMAYVGIGWAMARLPRFLWAKSSRLDPLLRWLVLDGYGFHQAYFRTRRYVHERFQEPVFRWPPDGPSWYANRVIDQGIGRAMWFVGGADADLVSTLIDRFPEDRRADLYSGAGLAATYAGGADEDELRSLQKRAGAHRFQLAQGSAFAAAARVRAQLVVAHTEVATQVFCGMSPAAAAELTDSVLAALPPDGELPAYEIWRQRTAHEIAAREDARPR
jgi:enediyne biosynthesis protein E3